MKKNVLTIALLLITNLLFAQSYIVLVSRADSAYDAKDYKLSALTYSRAFKLYNLKVTQNDLYNAACSWALYNNADSAFSILNRAVNEKNYYNINHISNDADLTVLHTDNRWARLIDRVKQNKTKAEAKFNMPLTKILDSVLTSDQEGRRHISEISAKYGYQSKEMDKLWQTIGTADSINLITVTAILDKYGWLGPETVGNQGSMALFLVIQHSSQQVQEKYLPVMRKAVKEGKALAANLALLEDRVALEEGKKQIYGSQVQTDPKTGKSSFRPIEDEPNVDKRREEVGLGPLRDYAKLFNFDYQVPVK